MAPLPYLSEIVSGLHSWSGYIRDVINRAPVKTMTGAMLALSARDIASCPGYRVTGTSLVGNSITANLQLAGQACNIYGTDLDNLQLLVEYQTGEARAITAAYFPDLKA